LLFVFPYSFVLSSLITYISVNTTINNTYVYSLYRHVSTRMSHLQAITRTIFVYKVTVLIIVVLTEIYVIK